jgi:hypothetical protein
MVASSPSSRSITVADSTQGLPRVVEAFFGSFLELVIHSIEGVRERLGRLSLR